MGWRDIVESDKQNLESLIREQPKERSWRDSVIEMFTGSDRKTAETEYLPEGVDLPFEFSGRQAKAALGTLFTFDPKREMTVLLEQYPDLKFDQDAKGNILVDSSAYGGGMSVLNKPGMSLEDIIKMGGIVGAFTPAGRAASGGTLLGGMARGALASGATQAGLDLGVQALGGVGEGEQKGVQLSDISGGDVVAAALGGAGGELVSRGLSKAFQFFRKAAPMPIDDATKQAIGNVDKQVNQYIQDTGEVMSKQQIIDLFRQNNISDEIAQQLLRDTPEDIITVISQNVENVPYDKKVIDAVKRIDQGIVEHARETGNVLSKSEISSIFKGYGISDDVIEKLVADIPDRFRPTAYTGKAPIASNVDDIIAQEAKLAGEQSTRYRIPYSEAQRTGSVSGKQFEEQALGGAYGQEAQNAALQLKAAQASAIPQAVRTEAQMMSNQPLVGSAVDAAEASIAGVNREASKAYQAVQEAYDQVPKGTFYRPEAIKGVTRAMRKSMIGAEFDKTLPKTAKALEDTAKMDKVMTVLEKYDARFKKKVARFPFEQVENYRRKLNGYIAGADNITDQRQLIIMRDAMDEYLDKAVADGLLHGDNTALDALKSARSIRRRYSVTYEPQVMKARSGVRQSDPAGVLINKMAELNPDAGDVSRALFGSGNLLGKSGSANLASRIKGITGESSPEWQQIRQAAFLKIFGLDKGQLTQSTKEGVYVSGADSLNRLQDVIGGNNKELGRVLFSKDEINQMVGLARAIKRAQPAPFNPSGTSPAVNKTLNEMGSKIMQMMAFQNPISGALFTAASKGTAAISDKQATQLAAQVFSGRPLQSYTTNMAASAAGATAQIPTIPLRSGSTKQQEIPR